eukprot:m.336450 g.336450  ORF g.336450 m.336450 type:complete len:345 (+) comp17855_c0_seq1:90-1124(+)
MASRAAGQPLRHFLKMTDFTPAQLGTVINAAIEYKTAPRRPQSEILRGKTMGMIFEKPSLRTHVSFETVMSHLGGTAIYLGPQQIGSLDGSREPVKDISNVLTRMCDIVVARVFKQETVFQLAEHAQCPVINALCDMEHPCQIVADLTTITEHKGNLNGLKVAFIGDGCNNVTHSLSIGCAMMGMHFSVASPTAAFMDNGVLETATQIAAETGGSVKQVVDPMEAADGADIVYTDTFVSMGDESRKEELLKIFDGYQVNEAIMKAAKTDALFMHDMPAYRGIEVSEGVIDGKQSIIYDQAENRLHGQKAVVLHLLGKLPTTTTAPDFQNPPIGLGQTGPVLGNN